MEASSAPSEGHVRQKSCSNRVGHQRSLSVGKGSTQSLPYGMQSSDGCSLLRRHSLRNKAEDKLERIPSDRGGRTQIRLQAFGIPATEHLLDEFHCALKKKILLQGRLHIFDHHLCFSSNVFGFVTRKAINFADVVKIMKKTYFRLPNSIEIHDIFGQKYFFTSFLSRDDAFRLMINCWSQARREISHPTNKPARKRQISDSSSQGHEFGARTDRNYLSTLVHDRNPSTSGQDRDAANDNSAEGSPAQSGHGIRTEMSSPGRASSGPTKPSHVHRRTMSSADGGQVYGFEYDEDADEDGADPDSVWKLILGSPVPDVEKDIRVIISTVLPGSPKDFFDLVLADHSSFMEDVLEELGNRKINISAWKQHKEMGHVRDVQFTAPIKGAFSSWGVPWTQCYQSQRFGRYSDDHLVFEYSQTMTDIPYGDCFTVDIRWDVTRTDSSALEGLQTWSKDAPSFMGPGPHVSPSLRREELLQVEITLRIPFSRSCLFKRVIQSGTNKSVLENYTVIFQAMQEAMKEKLENEALMPTAEGDESKEQQPADEVIDKVRMISSGSQGALTKSPSNTAISLAVNQQQQQQQQLHKPLASLKPSASVIFTPDTIKVEPSKSSHSTAMNVMLLLLLCLQCYVAWQLKYGSGLRAPRNSGPSQGTRYQGENLWSRKLHFLHSELDLLRQHIESVVGEVAATLRKLEARPAP